MVLAMSSLSSPSQTRNVAALIAASPCSRISPARPLLERPAHSSIHADERRKAAIAHTVPAGSRRRSWNIVRTASLWGSSASKRAITTSNRRSRALAAGSESGSTACATAMSMRRENAVKSACFDG